MKSGLVWVVTAAAALLVTAHLQAQNANNPLDVAVLRWYQINTGSTLSTCTDPQSLTFDGAHIWVACFNISNHGTTTPIQEFNRSDGALIRTVNVPVTGNTLSVTLGFDGANIWAGDNDNPGKLYKIQASTGTILSTISIPANYPTVGSFDGTYIWTANGGNNSVSKVNVATGAVTTMPLFSCVTPIGPVFDGTNYWVACQMNSNPDPQIVQELDSSGNDQGDINVGLSPGSLVFDGTNIWVGNFSFYQGMKVSTTRINVNTLATATFPTTGSCGNTGSLAFDGVYLWVSGSTLTGANCGSGSQVGTVSKLLVSTGAMVSTYTIGSSGDFAFDGANLWEISGTSGVTKY